MLLIKQGDHLGFTTLFDVKDKVSQLLSHQEYTPTMRVIQPFW